MFEPEVCTIGGRPVDRHVRWLATDAGSEPYCACHGWAIEFGWALMDAYGVDNDLVVRIKTFLESTIGLACPPLPELDDEPVPDCPGLALGGGR